jgi:hypothetical protein
MKKLIIIVGLITFGLIQNSCTKEELDQALATQGVTDEEIVKGLKSALEVGTDTSVKTTNKTDGYYANAAIKIFLPTEVNSVIDKVKLVPGGTTLVTNTIEKLNRAAEDAAGEAKPIFVNAITSMTIADGKTILFGKDSFGATTYLKTKTTADLKLAFNPKIKVSLDKVGATDIWKTFANTYNLVSTTKLNTDLVDYTTTKALDGLFYVVGTEEQAIRKDPLARVNSILQKVFGELDKK